MWNRIELKERGKISFKRSYWKSVLVCVILLFLSFGVGGGGSSSVSSTASSYINNKVNNGYYEDYDENYYNDDGEQFYDEYSSDETFIEEDIGIFFSVFAPIVIIIVVILFIIGIVIKFFVAYPLQIGANNFFMNIREREGSLDSLICIYKSGKLKNSVITMFMQELFIFLWSLLLVIPGIIKSYEYRMIPYILCENPNIDRKRAFEISKQMMMGNKWNTFILDLSFIGWNILSAITFGVVGVFYVNPYIQATNAELYAVLREDALINGYVDEMELIGFN